MTTTETGIVEKVARAICDRRLGDAGRYDEAPEEIKDAWRAYARAAIAAMPDSTQLLQTAWQPIETAPRDGTGVLVICMGAEKPEAGSGWFVGGCWTTLDPDGAEEFGVDFFRASVWHNPTHWRPLPEPPTQFRAQEQRRAM